MKNIALVKRKTMQKKRTYKRGLDFPNEGFVQLSIEAHFRTAGFVLTNDGQVDLLCHHPVTGESWHIEAKGKTTNVGLDFRTCLGQLVQRMHSQNSNYGIAIPDTPDFRKQVAKLSIWVVATLRINWLFVSQNGDVQVIDPADSRLSLKVD